MNPQEHADIAIVTVSTNKLDSACLTSVRRLLAHTSLDVRFIVVDNASTAFDAHAYVKSFVPESIVVLRDRNCGFGSSCNRGAQEIHADYYFFLNPDTRIDDVTVVDKLHAFFKRYPRVGIVAPKILYMDGRVQETCRRFPSWYTPLVQRTSLLDKKKSEVHRRTFLMEDFGHHKRRLVDWVQGSAFMIDGKLFRELGGFDDRYFMYYEDVDLCRQCWERGRPVYYLPEAVVYHAYAKESAKGGGMVSQLLSNRQTRAHIKSWLRYSAKWFGKKV
ncbi:glycosyltransferase family 2 protein [Patescibacteria group bacterium]|nr:MAG: glycosyltransferase family 2 protein [Patescibacteria group bacterium]